MAAPSTSPAARLMPFGRDERPRVIEELAADPEVRDAAEQEASRAGRPLEAVLAEAREYAHEIVPQFNARLHHRIAYRFSRRLATLLFRVRVGHVEDTLHTIPSDASVVFVMNHRSNMDYVLVAFLAAEHVVLSFAAGEWARVWPLDTLVRALGAFFVRRRSNNGVYRKVLERYVQAAVAHGVTQAVFLEGGLSRDGRLQPPRFGLLGYTIRNFSKSTPRDLVFVPVAVNYDRVLEDRTLLRDLDPTLPRRSRLRTILTTLGWMTKNSTLYLRGRLHRFGYACVNFGSPISFRQYLDERGVDMAAMSDAGRASETERLTTLLMDEIAGIVPVTPVSLVATALLSFEGHTAPSAALHERVSALVEELASSGAHVYVPRRDAGYFFEVGLRMLTLRRLVSVDDGMCRVTAGETKTVEYYANSIAHFFATRDTANPSFPLRTAATGTRAVVLVHGLARTSRSMARAGEALRAAGYDVYNWDYPSRRFGITALVDALEEFVTEVSARSGRVDFVTHSLGGLLARGVLARGRVPNAGRLVMLAPPNRGAALAQQVREYGWARTFYGPVLNDLGALSAGDAAVGSEPAALPCEVGIIAGTKSFHPLQPTSYYSSLVRQTGPHDGTLHVDETRLPGMTDFVTVNANHMFIMEDEQALKQALSFLERGRFVHS